MLLSFYRIYRSLASYMRSPKFRYTSLRQQQLWWLETHGHTFRVTHGHLYSASTRHRMKLRDCFIGGKGCFHARVLLLETISHWWKSQSRAGDGRLISVLTQPESETWMPDRSTESSMWKQEHRRCLHNSLTYLIASCTLQSHGYPTTSTRRALNIIIEPNATCCLPAPCNPTSEQM